MLILRVIVLAGSGLQDVGQTQPHTLEFSIQSHRERNLIQMVNTLDNISQN